MMSQGSCVMCMVCVCSYFWSMFCLHFVLSKTNPCCQVMASWCRRLQILDDPVRKTQEKNEQMRNMFTEESQFYLRNEKRVNLLWLFGYLMSQSYSFVIELRVIIFCLLNTSNNKKVLFKTSCWTEESFSSLWKRLKSWRAQTVI